MFFSKKLKKFHNISHCFFSRQSGFSKGIYESLNCGEGSRDLKENILKNLNFVSEKVGCKNDSLFTLNQRHTNKNTQLLSTSELFLICYRNVPYFIGVG